MEHPQCLISSKTQSLNAYDIHPFLSTTNTVENEHGYHQLIELKCHTTIPFGHDIHQGEGVKKTNNFALAAEFDYQLCNNGNNSNSSSLSIVAYSFKNILLIFTLSNGIQSQPEMEIEVEFDHDITHLAWDLTGLCCLVADAAGMLFFMSTIGEIVFSYKLIPSKF